MKCICTYLWERHTHFIVSNPLQMQQQQQQQQHWTNLWPGENMLKTSRPEWTGIARWMPFFSETLLFTMVFIAFFIKVRRNLFFIHLMLRCDGCVLYVHSVYTVLFDSCFISLLLGTRMHGLSRARFALWVGQVSENCISSRLTSNYKETRNPGWFNFVHS